MNELSNNYPPPNRRPIRELPQLSNVDLLRNRRLRRIFFPGGRLDPPVAGFRQLSLQRIVLPKQFIAADKQLGFLRVGMEVDLAVINEDDRVIDRKIYSAVVKQARQFERGGKRYVLLESKTSLLALEGAKNIRISIKGVLVTEESSGVIHPGGSNGGAGTVHAGGQSNAYGVGNLIYPLLQDPLPVGLETDRATFENDAQLAYPTIAVLDTGLLYQNPPTNRQPVAPEDEINFELYGNSHGWDFVHCDASPVDDHPHWHGTKISSILKKIASNQVGEPIERGTSKKADQFGILPVKIANNLGVLTLYNAICGLAYAKSKGVRLVNASWSFTGLSETLELPSRTDDIGNIIFQRKPSLALPDFPLLYQAVKDLRDAGIMVIAAAGNRSQYPSPTGEIGADKAPLIYPACYSPVLSNVITVTTISYQLQNPHDQSDGSKHYIAYENYSSKYVDAGVLTNADVHLEQPDNVQTGTFFIPGFSTSRAEADTFRGTSFATPYMAGRIASLLAQPAFITPKTVSSKNAIIAELDEFNPTDDLDNVVHKPGFYPAD